jgi:hypothetical protein
VKQRHNLAARRVYTGEIGPLPKITAMTRHRQIITIVDTPVLLRDDVFNVMDELAVLLPKQTVFATVFRAPADELPQRGVHR